MKVLVTGATGYIGKRLTSLALKRHHDVVVACRRRPSSSTASWLPFDLASDNSIRLPSVTDCVVHLAANTMSSSGFDEESEVAAAIKIIKSAQRIGARFIFVSSQSARVDAPTAYGRIKWRIEQEVLSAGGLVVRPGQVYGGELQGLFGLLVRTVRHLPILPAFLPAPKVQPIHVDDLAEGLLRIVERRVASSQVYCLATPEPVSFSIFLKEIAQSRLRGRRIFVPVPVVAINALVTILGEAFCDRMGLGRLRSLFALPTMDTASDLKQIGLVLRPLRSGMHPAGDDRRRSLLREGQALLTYLLKESPGSALLRRYVSVVERARGGRALGLPLVFLNYPLFLSGIDELAWADKFVGAEFSWRLDAATMLAEATPAGAYRFLGLGREHGMLGSLLALTNAVAGELFWRISRWLFFPLIRLTLRRVKCAA